MMTYPTLYQGDIKITIIQIPKKLKASVIIILIKLSHLMEAEELTIISQWCPLKLLISHIKALSKDLTYLASRIAREMELIRI